MPSRKDLALLTLLIIALGFGLASLSEKFRNQFRETFLNHQRRVLATVRTQLSGPQDPIVILKVKVGNDLVVEIYTDFQDSAPQFRSRLILPEKKEAFFRLQGKVTNLAALDLDRDGIPEIIVPTYDRDLIPRLRIYKYDQKGDSFQLLESEKINELGDFVAPDPND